MIQPDNDLSERPGSLQQSVVGVVIIYLGGFLAILLDEQLFRTFYFHSHSPGWVVDALEFVYWPLIVLVRSIG